MCSNPASPYLVGFQREQRRAIVVKSNCDMWECEECAQRKRSRWVARAILGCNEIRSNGSSVKFVTITTAEWYADTADAIATFPRAWEKLYARMKRKNSQLMYLLTVEFGKKTGHMHAHFLTNYDEKTRWFKNNARACGLGYQAKVEEVENNDKVAGYVSKYIGKSLAGHALPRKFRRVRCSQNWTQLDELEAHEQARDCDWLVCNTSDALWWCVEECQREKFALVDMNTGEYFDYQDAVEHWYEGAS